MFKLFHRKTPLMKVTESVDESLSRIGRCRFWFFAIGIITIIILEIYICFNINDDKCDKHYNRINPPHYGFFSPDYGFNDTTGTPSRPEIIRNPEPETFIVSRIPDFLGGGAYNNIPGKPNLLLYTGRTNYGGIAKQPEKRREDLIPVALGGSNSSPENIRVIDKELGKKLAAFEHQVIRNHRDGKIGLKEAQIKVLTSKQRMLENLDSNPHSFNNISKALKEILRRWLSFHVPMER